MVSRQSLVTEGDIRAWCLDYLLTTLKLPARWVHPEVKFSRMGMDSAMAVYFVMALEEWLETELPPEVLYERTTVSDLARHLAGAARA